MFPLYYIQIDVSDRFNIFIAITKDVVGILKHATHSTMYVVPMSYCFNISYKNTSIECLLQT